MNKILITEQQFKTLIENIIKEETREEVQEWLRRKWKVGDYFFKILDNLKEKKSDKYPESIFYVDKNTEEVYMEHDKKYGDLWIDYDKIWSFFESNYSINHEEIRDLMKELVGEHMNLWGVTPATHRLHYYSRWENI